MTGSVVLVDFSFWRAPEAAQQYVLDGIQRRFDGTGVLVTSDPELAHAITDGPLNLLLHEGTLDVPGDDAVGRQVSSDTAILDVQHIAEEFPGDVLHHLDAVATIGAHEAGHMLLPAGHSIDGINLLSSAKHIQQQIALDGGQSLGFTELQLELLRNGQGPAEGITLAQVEMLQLHGIELPGFAAAQVADAEDPFEAFTKLLDTDLLDPDLASLLTAAVDLLG